MQHFEDSFDLRERLGSEAPRQQSGERDQGGGRGAQGVEEKGHGSGLSLTLCSPNSGVWHLEGQQQRELAMRGARPCPQPRSLGGAAAAGH